MNAIEVNDVKKVYGSGPAAFEALKGISFTIKKGESIAIIGKSGSGKSTLMHILALLDRPSSGKIALLNQDTQKINKRTLNKMRNETFGFVFQQFFMNPKDTVLSNVVLPLKIAGLSSRQRKEMAIDALEAVELSDKANNKANDLSGGQKQRVCIARAIVNQPEIIFADEPTGNLDSTTGEKIEELLFNLNQNKGITLIIVTHDPELAARCDRQIHIKDGQLLEGA
ncbi:ABC transporter ATP-binding protein [Enterococcus raffinosus]|uniref:ABC transporter ATP-binding protein n=1 Tax=Enterococcus raffinosus TaxID=71452 RepID=A0AAW8TCT6_9ENTE|nr:ABC transporter ATP-binding protein [Enterococcus raffinosus]MDT2525070.1 ABC transporter ATP-binding protein [Enterococcus raffinosus]MDT2531371.1 ABC transporter ATP-binding protein [Enterococcus raffinosus]MDT2534554.1 ABC transporter ATP-binding protein [Enterococcus raffinosus]MDT2545606.1 ABC transporter ATP-binding protein [Enterococcus raffinosus]MDT2555524.1 ABC transporter ATP-binding protein [Enterococcus raffinosus]